MPVAFRDRVGKIIGAVIVFHDVTKERRLKRALAYQASHDALTGLINRREFDNRLHEAVQSARRDGARYALLYVALLPGFISPDADAASQHDG